MNADNLKTAAGFLAILELDNNRELAQDLGLDLSLADNLEILHEINASLLELGKEVTGVIFDPVYTFDLISKKTTNAKALLCLEQDREVMPDELPALFPNFSLEEIANNYALAKLELNYHPKEKMALEKKQLLSEIKEYSKVLDIAFLLKLKLFDPSKFALTETKFSFDDDQLEAIQELRSLADILAIQNPSDPLAMATIASELDAPCLITADERDSYDQFKDKFRMAMENGASGYCLGNLLWKEMSKYRQEDNSLDVEAIKKYISTTVRDRAIELNRIASEGLESR